MDWRDEVRQRFGSQRELARELHKHLQPSLRKRWPNLHNYVNKLWNHDTRWWTRTGAEALSALAELLGRTTEELLGAPPARQGIGFAEFPRLPPLGPEETPFVARGASLIGVALDLHEGSPPSADYRHWIVVPPGGGASLTVRYLQGRRRVCAVEAETLEAALVHLDGHELLVVAVERPDRSDRSAMLAMRQRVRACAVLAPFELPIATQTLELAKTYGLWDVVRPTPFRVWRNEFAKWIVDRIASVPGYDSKLDADDLVAWLDKHDPRGELIATPGDLLALCDDIDRCGDTDRNLATRARRWLRDRGLGGDGERPKLARRAYESATADHFMHLEAALGEADVARWESWVPRATGPRDDEDRFAPALAIATYRECGVLRAGERGLVPFPRWVAQGLVERRLEPLFADAGELRTWGRIAADASRRASVDLALDGLGSKAFDTLVSDVVGSFDAKSLGAVGALEATFAAAARRLHRAGSPGARWSRLLELQLGTLMPDRPEPYTRRDAEELVAGTWVFSLRLPRPAKWKARTGWLLPGWSEGLRLSELPRWFPIGVDEHRELDRDAPTRRLLELSVEVVSRVELEAIPENVTRLLVPAFLLDARPWAVTAEHFKMLRADLHEERWLAAHADGLDIEGRARVADRVWQAIGRASVAERIQTLNELHRPLAGLVLPNVPVTTLERTVAEDGLHMRSLGGQSIRQHDAAWLVRLDRDRRHAALRAWLRRAPTGALPKFREAYDLIQSFDADDVELAIELSREADEHVAADLARFVWGSSPASARVETVEALRGELRSAQSWFYTAPRSEVPALVELLRGRASTPEWMRRWAYMRALDAGAAAEDLYVLSRG